MTAEYLVRRSNGDALSEDVRDAPVPDMWDLTGPPTCWSAASAGSPADTEGRTSRTSSLAKGSRVVVVGRLVERSWQTNDGSTRSVVEVVAAELGPSLRWASATTTRMARSRSQ
jgi:hypothetical protein